MTPEEFDTKWGPKTAFKTIGRHGEFVKDLASVLAAEREAIMEYINLLGDECADHAAFMANRFPNWKSPRYEQGVELRKKLGIPERERR